MIRITMKGSDVSLHMTSEEAKRLYDYLYCSEVIGDDVGSKEASDVAWKVENALGDLIRGGR